MLPGAKLSSTKRKGGVNATTVLSGSVGFVFGVCVTALLFVYLGQNSRVDVTSSEGGSSRIAGQLMDPSSTYGGVAAGDEAQSLPVDDLGSPAGMIVMVPFSGSVDPKVARRLERGCDQH